MSASAAPIPTALESARRASGRMSGPPREVASLFDEAADLVHRTAWRITGSPADADDVLQGVFLQLLGSPPSPWPERPVSYVHRASVNAALDVLRRRKRRVEDSLDAEPPADPGRDTEDVAVSRIEQRRLAARLREGLAELSPLQAEVFSLRFFEERTNAEIAELLGKTTNHVGVTLHAARAKLRELVAPGARERDSPAASASPPSAPDADPSAGEPAGDPR